jgi:hypothetical protein
MMGGALEGSFFGNGSAITGDVVPMYADESARFTTNALLATGIEVPGTERFQIQDFDENGGPYHRLMTTAELEEHRIYKTPDELGGDLNEALERKLGLGRSPVVPFGDQYDRITQ